MNLAELLTQSGLSWRWHGATPSDAATLAVTSVTADSRTVAPGALFIAFDGLTVRGLDFAAAAASAGAVAIVADRAPPSLNVPVLIVADSRAAIGPLASAFYGHPSRDLNVLAVTGTNGKTTTAVMTAGLLAAAGRRAAALGTLGLWTPEGTEPGGLTTPDAVELQARLAALRDAGFSHVCLEASSHALDQRRLDGTRIAAAAWTNLSRDHLDYHGDEASYFAAKSRLFKELLASGTPAFVNGDDHRCVAMQQAGLASSWTFEDAPGAAAKVMDLKVNRDGLTLTLHSTDRPPLDLCAPLPGRHNAANLVAATLLCRAVGVTDEAIAAAAAGLKPPRGRFEPVPNDLGALIVVDYAHTPDALAHTLRTGRELVAVGGRLVVVFGCGGDRDRGKRAPMGAVAGQLADLCVVTSDNPRGEAPEAIIAAITVGLRQTAAVQVSVYEVAARSATEAAGWLQEADRRIAIDLAVTHLRAGDVLVIAGKGHETSQTIAGQAFPFDDAAEVAAALTRGARSAHPPTHAGAMGQDGRAFEFDGLSAAAACGGTLVGAGVAGSRLCTDSRAVDREAIFVALVGERFDANDFLPAVVTAGAAGIICSPGKAAALRSAAAGGTWLVEVPDTLVALGDLCRAHRRRFDGRVVGVTGSNGKTTTKELLALALADAGPVLATHANHNNRVGVPLTLARMEARHRVAIIEMGTSEPGEIAELARIAEPHVGVITSIAEAHLTGLGSIEQVAAEKAALLKALPSDGVAVVPADEPLLAQHTARLTCRVLRFGLDASADVHLHEPVTITPAGQSFMANVCGRLVHVALPALGVHMVHDALAALAVAAALAVDAQSAAAALAAYQPVGQRMRPLRVGDRLLLEDCYNANPRSTEVALQTLQGLPEPRVAVLGDMLELGDQSAALHARVAATAARLGVDTLIALGSHAPDYVAGAGTDMKAVAVADVAAAVAAIRAATPKGGTVLVKGSRGARMERIIEALQADAGNNKQEVSGVSLAV